MSKFYPIGTIVKLNFAEERLFMIAGFYPKRTDSKPFDFFAVPFPLGMLDETQYVCFDSESITEVVCEGYSNEQSESLSSGLEEFSENLHHPLP